MRRKSHEEIAAELALAFGHLVRRLRSAAPSETRELPWTQKAVLLRLESDGPATTADLARAEAVKPQSMGATIAALEELGMVERKPHPTDGRQMLVGLTERGAAIRKDVRVAKQALIANAIAKLDPSDQQQLPALTELIKRLGEEL